MKYPLLTTLVLCLFARGQKTQGEAVKNLGQAATDWAGVTFAVTGIASVDNTHILVAGAWIANASVVYPTRIRLSPPARFLPPHPTLEQMLDEKYRPLPFRLATARLLDQKSRFLYPAIAVLPSEPYWAPSRIITNLGTTTWIQPAVQFTAPHPPPSGPDGKIAEPEVSLFFPKAKSPIKNVIVPPTPTKRNPRNRSLGDAADVISLPSEG
jgi:hypothetical protein